MSCLVQFFKEQSKALRTALFVVAFLSGVAFGQIESGQLTGKVYDPNGARITGAVVQAKSEETGLERMATTTDDGFFIISNLPPGIYEVGMQAQGFAVTSQRVRVFVGSVVRIDTQLSVTPVQVDEYVVDGSGGVEINTQTGQLSYPISWRQLRELPTITRDPYSLITLAGNVTPFRINPLGGGGGGPADNFVNRILVNTEPDQDFSINGIPPTFNNVTVDGGENIINYWTTLGQRLPLDGVQEINVITNGFRPEYGRLGGGLINVASRAGGNNWRGSVFSFYRSGSFNANSFENNALGIDRPHLVGNNFGFAAGGPVIDDKLYFFATAEGLINRSTQEQVAVVPTPELLASSDPATQAFFGNFPLKNDVRMGRAFTVGQTLGLLGTNNTPLGAFSGLNPALPAFQQVFFTTPTNFGAGLPQDTGLALTRVDYNLTDRSLIYARYAFLDRDIYRGSLSASPFFGFDTGVRERDHMATINWLHTISGPDCCSGPGASPWVVNLKVHYNRVNLIRSDDFNTVGPRISPTGFDFANIGQFPIAFPGDFPFSPTQNSLLTGPLNIFQVGPDFAGSWHGHQVQFGGAYFHFQDNRNIFSNQSGQYTLGSNVPSALDNLVLGTASSFTTAVDPLGALPGQGIVTPVLPPDFSRSISSNDFMLYGSFNWRVTPNFNLLFGLRYDFFGRPNFRNNGDFFNFFPGPGASTAEQIANGSLAPTGAVIGPSGNIRNSFFNSDTNNIAPRIGFAWDITGRGRSCCSGGGFRRSTTLRASYGITYERLFYAVAPFFQNSFNFAIPTFVSGTFDPNGNLIPPIPLSANNFGPLGAPGVTALPNFLVRSIDQHLQAPKIHFWTVALDREIFHNTILSLQYAGSAGRNLFTLDNINLPGSAPTFLGLGASTERLNTDLGPIFNLSSNGRSNYNAFIVDFSNSTWRTIGLQFTARYRFAKALDNVPSFLGNNFGTFGGSLTPNLLSPFNPNFDYGPSDFDVRHRFIGSVIWEVPYHWFDGGGNCCGGGGGWKKWVLGGWEMAGIFQAMSGFPYTVLDCSAALTPETPCPRAVTAPGIDAGDLVSGFGSRFADPNVPNRFAYLPGGNFQLINAPTTGLPPFFDSTGRNFFRGPGFWDVDFGIYKRFHITEETGFQLRGEFYNVFNHSNLFVPSLVDISSTNFVPAFRNGGRIIQVGAKFTF